MKHYFKLLLATTLYLFGSAVYGQTALPYYNTFDDATTVTNWTHYAISGTDDWLVTPNFGEYPQAWKTSLYDSAAAASERALETPSFDFTSANANYIISFKHFTKGYNNTNFKLEYSTDNGTSWLLLNNTTSQKLNWQGTSGFFTNYSSSTKSSFNLGFLAGQQNVKFRFIYKTVSSGNYGWIIEDLYVGTDNTNIIAIAPQAATISANCMNFTVQGILNFNNAYSTAYSLKTKYYLSQDMTLDAGDALIGEKDLFASGSNDYWNQDVIIPQNTAVGNYYILIVYDATNAVPELIETDNVAVQSLTIQGVYTLPYQEDFEGPQAAGNWPASVYYMTDEELLWELGSATRHRITGAHSGTHAWHTSKTYEVNSEIFSPQWVESPFFDLTPTEMPLVLNFWTMGSDSFKIEYTTGCDGIWTELYTIYPATPNTWDFINVPLDALAGNDNVRFRMSYKPQFIFSQPDGVAFDDIYVGPDKGDAAIYGISDERYIPFTGSGSMDLHYTLANTGGVELPNTTTKFYWSADAVLDAGDQLLGSHAEEVLYPFSTTPSVFTFTKPAVSGGIYYVIYKMDANNSADETREDNNIGAIKIVHTSLGQYPYYNDFETETTGWSHNASLGTDDWKHSTGGDTAMSTPFSGTKAWFARNNEGSLTKNSRMHLYTPVFNLSLAINPVLEFDMNLVTERNFDGGLNMSYSTDNGATWEVLDIKENPSYNRWYYPKLYERDLGEDINYTNTSRLLYNGGENAFAPIESYNGRDCDRLYHYNISLKHLINPETDLSKIRFRFNMGTLNNYIDGQPQDADSPKYVMIDNFSVKEGSPDLNLPYTKELQMSDLSNEIRFFMNINNSGNYISTETTVKFYLSTDAVFNESDYYAGEAALKAIRPDNKGYINVILPISVDLANYQYLVYKLDAANTNTESDETNNTGAWPLFLNSINSYPYVNEFEDVVVNGWNQYAVKNFATLTPEVNYRIRNIRAVGEEYSYVTTHNPVNGEWATEYTIYEPWVSVPRVPTFYLESPSFDFSNSNAEELYMTFDFAAVGIISDPWRSDGANMEYSTDGGNTWTVLTVDLGESTNWYYNNHILTALNQPGWNDQNLVYKHATFNLAYFNNEKDVVFRFKYYSFFTPAPHEGVGFRLDNYKIGNAADMGIILGTNAPKISWFTYYPNPVKDVLTIKAITQLTSIEVYSVTGQNVLGKTVQGTETTVDFSGLSKGMYIVKINADKASETVKIIVQ